MYLAGPRRDHHDDEEQAASSGMSAIPIGHRFNALLPISIGGSMRHLDTIDFIRAAVA
jgi:hypothetical protein